MTGLHFDPKHPGFAARVQASFDRQPAMRTIGAALTEIVPGRVVIELPWSAGLAQQHGFLHGGMLATALDTACGYAGLSLMPEDAAVLTIEFKINFLAPASGQRFRLVGEVVKPGRTVTVTEGRAFAINADREKLVATMTATLMAVVGRDGLQD